MRKASFIGGAIFLGTGAVILFTFILMWLWNWLMPVIFGIGIITFWQAAGLFILSKILFSGTGSGQKWHSDRRKKFWHSRFEEKWSKIPDEKKEKFARCMEEKGFNKKENDE